MLHMKANPFKFCRVPSTSIRKLAQEAGYCPTLVHSVLHDDLGLKAYKIKNRQILSEGDRKQRLDYAVSLEEKPQFCATVHQPCLVFR